MSLVHISVLITTLRIRWYFHGIDEGSDEAQLVNSELRDNPLL